MRLTARSRANFGVGAVSDELNVMSNAEPTRDGSPPNLPRHTRRLSDKVLVAFHHACDTSDLEIAEHLLRILELMLTRRPANTDVSRRRSLEGLVAAHERLWHLRHPATEQ